MERLGLREIALPAILMVLLGCPASQVGKVGLGAAMKVNIREGHHA